MQRRIIMAGASIILIISVLYQHVAGNGNVPRATLSQNEACYYQPYHKHLACQCVQASDKVYLPLHMDYWVRNMNQEVK